MILYFIIFEPAPIVIYPTTTIILQLSNLVPLEFLKVIVAVPADLAVTRPVSLTVATSVLLLVHKVLSVVLEGLTVPVSCIVFPTYTVSLVGLTARLVIGVITVIEHCAVYPFSVLTVIWASPFPINVRFPFSTVTTFLLLLSHTILLFTYVVSGNIVASNFGIFDEFLSNTNLE